MLVVLAEFVIEIVAVRKDNDGRDGAERQRVGDNSQPKEGKDRHIMIDVGFSWI